MAAQRGRGELTPFDAKALKIFSENLNRLIQTRKVSQAEIHEQTKIPKSTITGYVKARNLPNGGNLQKLADFFDVKKSDLDIRFEEDKNLEVKYKTSVYPFYPHSISAGNPFHADGVTQLENIELPDFVMGKYARAKDLLIMRINGESMNRLIPHGSLIAIKNVGISQLNDGDIVVYSHQNEYSVKQFYRRGNDVIFKPMSEDPTFTDYIVKEDDPELLIHGKVAIYIVER